MMRELLKLDSSIEFYGIGGEKMSAEGLNSIVLLRDISVVGFWEVAKKYSFFKSLIEKVKKEILRLKIDFFIAVDYPGFNQIIAKFCKSIGIPVVWYIAPQLWAWGEKRALKLAKIINDLLVVFPFEKEFFENYGISSHFVGHPLLDIPEYQSQKLSFEERKNQILFMPGSRQQEIKSHLPIIIKLNELINNNFNEFQTLLAIPNSLLDFLSKDLKNLGRLEITSDSKSAMLESKIGLIKSGTSNLEACLAGLPFAMFYKTSYLTYFLGKRMINLNFLSLVNILTERNVINEFIQSNANPKLIFEEIKKIINVQNHRNSIFEGFAEIRKLLGEKGASERVAGFIFDKYLK